MDVVMHSISVTDLEALAVKTSYEHYPETGPEILADFIAEARARYSAADDGPLDRYIADAAAIFARITERSVAFHQRIANLLQCYSHSPDQTVQEVVDQSPDAQEEFGRIAEEFSDVIDANPGIRAAREAELSAECDAVHAEAEDEGEPLDQAEHEAGYNAFMRRCTYYALAHSDHDPGDAWTKFWEAGQDDAPETYSYIEGWNDARARIIREAGIAFGAFATCRQQTATFKRLEATDPEFASRMKAYRERRH